MTTASPRLHPAFNLARESRLLGGMTAGALLDPHRPLFVHLVVTRRCNLSCGYCTEYDTTSPPVPLELLRDRIDCLARLRTVIVTLTGGETLLHPQLVELVSYVRACGMTAALNTNGLLLTAELIQGLNRAGLFALQLSVDAVASNEVTKKSLKPLLPKMQLLAEHAKFHVRVNTVLGAAPPEEALEVVRTVAAYGFGAKCSLLRRPDGTVAPLDPRALQIHAEIAKLEGRSLGLLGERFQDELLRDGRVEWKCRAGARFFHVCEDGRVHLCAPRWGSPGKLLADYTQDDLAEAFNAKKSCSVKCPVAYAHNVSQVDRFRRQEGAEQTHSLPAFGGAS